jgi:hypothetical protein
MVRSHGAGLRLSFIAALGILAASDPAAAQPGIGVHSGATASSYDEDYEPAGIDEDYDEEFSEVANDSVHAEASTCGLHPCAVPPPFSGEAESSAVTDFGRNEVNVRSETWSDGSNGSYRDEAGAGSGWEDELVFTSAQPIGSATIRAHFHIDGSWQNRACFGFAAFFYEVASESECTEVCCPCFDVAAAVETTNQSEGFCTPDTDFADGTLPVFFPDADDEDGQVDTTVTLEFPLVLDSPVRFGAILTGETAELNGSSLQSGIEAEILGLEVPFGVTVDSATNSEGSYNVPEPGGVAGAIAVGALAALRRRAARA